MKGSLSSTNNLNNITVNNDNNNNQNKNNGETKNQADNSNMKNEFLIPLIRETTKEINDNRNFK
jgi:hypothetical protein